MCQIHSAVYVALQTMYRLGVQVRNMKMDFNTAGTWRWVGQ